MPPLLIDQPQTENQTMDVEQLIDDTVAPELKTLLRKFPNAVDILKHIEELFVGLTKKTILTDVGEHVSVSGPVHIGNFGVERRGDEDTGTNVRGKRDAR